MKILELKEKDNKIVFLIENLQDLWVLKSIVVKGDIISGSSYRRQKRDDVSGSVRKPVYVSVKIEKYDYSYDFDSLRFTGIITNSNPSDLAPLGDHHTLEINLTEKYVLEKKVLLEYQKELLKTSSKLTNKINLIVLDEEKASVFELTDIGFKEVLNISSFKSGKSYKTDSKNLEKDYFTKIYDFLKEYNYNVLVAGPGNTKSKLKGFLKNNKFKPIVKEISVQNTSKASINELFTKPEVKKFFENSLIYKEFNLLEEFNKNLGKDNSKAIYGLSEIEKALNMGACKFIMISEKFWKNNIDVSQNLIKKADKIKTPVYVVDQDHKTAMTIDSFSGIISVLRFKINS